ncbi:unnamed protein product [Soboliphyme baturini]|uniref:Endoplasmic reticulum-Golgi intermediate compartment protein 1 n=1 Tax=Soboliphyme baturini TaxID=241478 RepID=A0A183IYA4_9BILA|nr:unnamed protein product [Soboliphyme baturini]
MKLDITRFDIYRKVPKDLTQPTITGAIISICCVMFILLLFLVSELFVDDARTDSHISVTANVSMLQLSCEYLGLDIQDELGRHEVGFIENVRKVPIEKSNGCRLEARFSINKVPGNFHLSTHSSEKQPSNPDMRHIIHSIRFGDDPTDKMKIGSFDALRSYERPGFSFEYVLKIVPTIHDDINGKRMYSYQYTYAHKEYIGVSLGGYVLPSVWFRYDLTPITVRYYERRQPIYAFITSICAIIGGTFTVAGIIDSLIFTASQMYKKFEIGKLH